MNSGPSDTAELARLRELGAWMRDVGATELSIGDLHIKLAPRLREVPVRPSGVTDDEAAALAKEDAAVEALSDEERAWVRQWRRVTRSSGAPIPPFPRAREMKAAP